MKPDIYKVESIGEGLLAVMAKPVSGEWIEDEFAGIAQLGIHHIVSLLEHEEALELGLQDEQELTEKNDMKFTSYSISDRGLPQSVKEYAEFTKSLYEGIVSGSHTVIHCRAGIGRAGMVAAGILLHHGLSTRQAFELISQKRRVEVPDTPEQYEWVESNQKRIIGS